MHNDLLVQALKERITYVLSACVWVSINVQREQMKTFYKLRLFAQVWFQVFDVQRFQDVQYVAGACRCERPLRSSKENCYGLKIKYVEYGVFFFVQVFPHQYIMRGNWEKLCTNEVYKLMKLLTNEIMQQNLCSNEGIQFFKMSCSTQVNHRQYNSYQKVKPLIITCNIPN